MEFNMEFYERNLNLLRESILLNTSDKSRWQYLAHYNPSPSLGSDQLTNLNLLELAHPWIEKLQKCEGNSDFGMVPLIRLVYLLPHDSLSVSTKLSLESLKHTIIECLEDFPFTPHSPSAAMKNTDKIVFWSENHLFMTLSSAYLLRQYIEMTGCKKGSKSLLSYPETKLLIKYLEIHCHPMFKGVYEVNSHVYLPYSLAALFNLFDFARSSYVVSMAEYIIDRIVYHLMLCTDQKNGITNLSASARAFERTRLRNFDHNINQLVNVMVGHSPDPMKMSYIAPFLLLTKWRPKPEAFEALQLEGFIGAVSLSHSVSDMNEIFDYDITSEPYLDEYTPLFWSAGLVTHSAFVTKTKEYQKIYKMQNNIHLWPISFFFWSTASLVRNMKHYDHFSAGQQYTDIRLNCYKRPKAGLCLTSFELFHPHKCGFQQLPWMANVNGLAVWSQSGSGSESIAGFGIHNTHNPAVQQRGDLLLLTYLAPEVLTSTVVVGGIFSYKVRFFWPFPFFSRSAFALHGSNITEGSYKRVEDRPTSAVGEFKSFLKGESRSSNVFGLPSKVKQMRWFVGQREDCYIATLCTEPVWIDDSSSKDAKMQPRREDTCMTIPRLVCEKKRQSWVVVVGTRDSYESLEAFVSKRLSQITVHQEKNHSKRFYRVMLRDGGPDSTLEYTHEMD